MTDADEALTDLELAYCMKWVSGYALDPSRLPRYARRLIGAALLGTFDEMEKARIEYEFYTHPADDLDEVAERLGISRKTLWSRRRRYGLDRITPEQREKMEQAYRLKSAGLKEPEIAERMGVSMPTVYEWLNQYQ